MSKIVGYQVEASNPTGAAPVCAECWAEIKSNTLLSNSLGELPIIGDDDGSFEYECIVCQDFF
jgi:DNA-directed RNA polymerase subunit RPC12/RpoP